MKCPQVICVGCKGSEGEVEQDLFRDIIDLTVSVCGGNVRDFSIL